MERLLKEPQIEEELPHSNRMEEILRQIPVRQFSAIDYYQAFVDASVLPKEKTAELFRIREKGVRASEEFVEKREAGKINPGDKDYHILQGKIEKGRKAEGKIIRHNLKLVVSIAGSLAGKYPHYENSRVLSFSDLVQEGIVGLKRAVEGYEVERGFSFANYATPWIKKIISDAILEHSQSVGFPKDRARDVAKVKKVQDRYLQELDRSPSIEELVDETGIKKELIEETMALQKGTKSLDEPLKNGGKSRTLGETIPDEVDVEAETDSKLEEERMMLGMILLDARERKVLVLRFGKGMTLKEVGQETGGLTRERIRQVQNEALEKLRKFIHEPGYAPEDSS